MTLLATLLRVSRPHLWLYTVGPFLFGVLAAMAGGHAVGAGWLTLWLLALTIPINLFIYGLNDYFDAATDARNPKKELLEYRADSNEYRLLLFALVGLLSVGVLMVGQPKFVWYLGVLWVVLVATYNMPPFRFKARPLLDLLLAGNYPLLGIIGYTMVAGQEPSAWVLIPIGLLSISFHVYSAIHDMPHDAADNVRTTALWLGSAERSLWVCVTAALGAAASFMWIGWWLVTCTLLPYAVFYAAHLVSDTLRHDALQSYTYFIYLQYIVGFMAVSAVLYYLGFFGVYT